MRELYKQYKHNNSVFLSLFALIWFIFLLVALEYSRVNAHYLLNSFHSPYLDVLFKYITYLGGGFPVFFGIAWCLWNLRQGLYILLSQGIASIITQVFKYTCAHPRPLTYFTELGISLPPTVQGVTILDAYNSFPSDYTSAVFALFTCLAAITPVKYKSLQVFWLLLAWLGAYSCIYLSQHFVDDILAGSIIGIFAAGAMYIVLFKQQWGNRPLLPLRK